MRPRSPSYGSLHPILLIHPGGPFPTDQQRPSALGAGDSTPCSGTVVSGIQSSAWSLCRQHPEGGAGAQRAEVRGQPALGQSTRVATLQEDRIVRDGQSTEKRAQEGHGLLRKGRRHPR